MVPKKDIFDQWSEEKEKEFWIVRKLKFIPSWWNHEGKYYFKMFIHLWGNKKIWQLNHLKITEF